MAIDLIRISGALFIFLCHACIESGNLIGGMLGQFFNVGVPIFFVLSGYLHSLKNAPAHILRWYAKKTTKADITAVCIPRIFSYHILC